MDRHRVAPVLVALSSVLVTCAVVVSNPPPNGPTARTCLVLDATGQPVAGAEVVVTFGRLEGEEELPAPFGRFFTKEDGTIPLPITRRVEGPMRFSHQEYGISRGTPDGTGEAPVFTAVQVKQGSEAHGRAVSGAVVGPDGRPVAGAVVRCGEVRTPGEGLIQYHGNVTALADEKGRFS